MNAWQCAHGTSGRGFNGDHTGQSTRTGLVRRIRLFLGIETIRCIETAVPNRSSGARGFSIWRGVLLLLRLLTKCSSKRGHWEYVLFEVLIHNDCFLGIIIDTAFRLLQRSVVILSKVQLIVVVSEASHFCCGHHFDGVCLCGELNGSF